MVERKTLSFFGISLSFGAVQTLIPAWRRDSRREVTSTAWRLLSVKTAISIATTSVELRAGDWPSTKLLPPVSEVCFSSAWR